ncbi:MAG: isocitrate lyase/PEP mutase family protein, partial [Pseudomonadota bacterium]
MSPAARLRSLLAEDRLLTMPCCYDALSAKLIEQAGFDLTFMSGFAASASRIGQPDLGLMSYAEVQDQAGNIADAISIPLIADGDTGYGNAMNVRRTVAGMAKAGAAA